MSNVTKPIILDETGQAIKAAIKEGASIVADKIKGGSKRYGAVYGFHVNSNESDPSAAVTYLKDAVGMTPARMNFLNNKFSYGSWADAFFMPRPCMVKYDGTVDYYLDPNDYDKKENGEVSALGDSSLGYGIKYQGNAMIEWGRDGQQIWTKCQPDANDPYSGSVYISNRKVDETYTAWPFINNQGVLTSHFYTAIYNGSLTAFRYNNTTYYRLRSIPRMIVMNSPDPDGATNNYDAPWDDGTDPEDPSTPTPSINFKTQASHEVEFALNNNPGLYVAKSDTYPDSTFMSTYRANIYWFTEVFCDIQLINNLLVLIGKSLNTQDVFGNGNMSGNTAYTVNKGVLYTGSSEYVGTDPAPGYTLQQSGLFWGTSGGANAVKTFGMENWWGNQYRRYAGHISKSSSITSDYDHFIKNTFGTDDGSSTVGYNSSGTGYIDTQVTIPASNNYITKSKFVDSVEASGVYYRIGTFLASVTAGAGSGSTFYSDYFYRDTGTRYALRGGTSVSGASCGAFFVNTRYDFSVVSWARGAALSFKPAA